MRSHNKTNCPRAHFSSEWLGAALCLKSHLRSPLKSIYLAHSKTTRGQGEAPLPFINNVDRVWGVWATVSLCVCDVHPCLCWESGHPNSLEVWESETWFMTSDPRAGQLQWVEIYFRKKHCQFKVIFHFGRMFSHSYFTLHLHFRHLADILCWCNLKSLQQ